MTRFIAHICTAAAVLLFVASCSTPQSKPELSSSSSQARSTGRSAPREDAVFVAPRTPASPEAQHVAETFARLWMSHTPHDEWYQMIAPLATDDYAALLATVNPDNVPATRITGATQVRESRTNSMTFTIPTDAGLLDVTCIPIDGQWRVATVTMRT